MQRALWSLLLCAACGSRGSAMTGQSWVSADRTAYLYESDRAIVSVRGAVTVRFAEGTGCFTESPGRVFVDAHSTRAIALEWQGSGAMWHGGRPSIDAGG